MKNAEIKALINGINSSDSEEDDKEEFSDDSQDEDMDVRPPIVATMTTLKGFEDEEGLSNESENEIKDQESSVAEEVANLTGEVSKIYEKSTVEGTSAIGNKKNAEKNEVDEPKEDGVAKNTKSKDKDQDEKPSRSRKRKSKKEVEMDTDQLIGELAVSMKNRKADHKKEMKAREKDSEYLFASTLLAEIKKMPYPLMCMAKNEINQVLFKYQMMMLSSQPNSSNNQINQPMSMPQNRINQSLQPNSIHQFMFPNQATLSNNLHQLMPQSNTQQYTTQQNPF